LSYLRTALARHMDKPRDSKHAGRMNLVLEVIMRAIDDLHLEFSDDLEKQLIGQSARTFLYGIEGEKTFEAIGINPNMALEFLSKYNQATVA